MKIQMGKCTICGSMAYLAEVAGLRAVVGPWPVTPDPWALIQGRCYVLDGTPEDGRLRVARLDDQTQGRPILADHEHRGAVRPLTAPVAPPACPAPQPTPPGPQTGAQAPSWPQSDPDPQLPFGLRPEQEGSKAATAGPARSATVLRSDRPEPRPTCDDCGQPCEPGTYWGIEHAGAFVFAQHAEPCS